MFRVVFDLDYLEIKSASARAAHVLCVCSIRSSSMNIIRVQTRCRLFVVMPLIDNVVLQVDVLCRAPIVRYVNPDTAELYVVY